MINEIENVELLYPHCEKAAAPDRITEKSAKTAVVYSPTMDFCLSVRMLIEDQCSVFTTTDPQLFMTLTNTMRPDLIIVDEFSSPKIKEYLEMMKRKQSHIRIMLIVRTRFSERWSLNECGLLVDGLFQQPSALHGLKQTVKALLHE